MAGSMQIGVVPVLTHNNKPRIILVTARGKERWLLPKGNQHPSRSRRQMALTEAYEEAGVVGTIRYRCYIDVPFRKDGSLITLRLYPMRVREVLKNWPERRQRRRAIVDLKRAKKLLGCKRLCAALDHLVCYAAG